MEYRFEFAPRALAQAREVHDWIAESSPERAAKWYQGLFETIETLKTFPMRCPLAPESDAYGEDVRQLLYGKRRAAYRILFTIRDDVIRHRRHPAQCPWTCRALIPPSNCRCEDRA
jgi:plasmid stabilization system protein ParE